MNSIKFRLSSSMFGAVVSTTTILLFYLYQVFLQIGNHALTEHSQTVAEISAHSVNEWLEFQTGVLTSIEPIPIDEPSNAALKQAFKAGNFQNVYFANLLGETTFAQEVELPDDFDARTRPWYQSALNSSTPILSDSYIDILTGERVVTVSYQLLNHNRHPIGILGADIQLSQMIDDLSLISMGKGSHIGLLENERFISHPTASFTDQHITSWSNTLSTDRIQIALSEKEAVFYQGVSEERLMYFVSIPDTNWLIYVDIDADREFEPLMEIIQNIVIFGIVISLLVTFIGFCTVKYSLSGLNNINTALQDFVEGDGDLTQRLYEGRNDEVGQVAHRFNIFVNQLQMFMSNLDRVVEDLTVKAASLNSDSQKGQTSLTAQQSELESISTALNQMQISILQVAEGASLSASTITESLKQAKYGEQATIRSNSAISSLAEEISKSVDKIGALNNYSSSVSQIVSDIEDIADQTNLLALNAAIEAARAGESGRGFAVVADEVRNLAQRTRHSTASIQDVITKLQEMTNASVVAIENTQVFSSESLNYSNKAVNSFVSLQSALKEVNDLATQTAAATEEQSVVTKDISNNMLEIKTLSDAILNSSKGNTERAKSLDSLASNVKNELGKYSYQLVK